MFNLSSDLPSTLNAKRLGPVRLIRPSAQVIDLIRIEAQKHLLARFPKGTFKSPSDINDIIQHQFSFYDAQLRKTVGLLASRDASEFLLFQYDEASRILHGKGLNVDEAPEWSKTEGCFRRAIKYILELMCMRRPPAIAAVPESWAGFTMELVIALAENAVHLSEMSHRVFTLFPEQWSAVVGTADEKDDLTLRISGPDEDYDKTFHARTARDRRARGQFIPMPQFDIHTAIHQQYLDHAFRGSFDMSYGEFIFVIAQTIKESRPAAKGFPTLFVRQDHLFDQLAKSGLPRASIEVAIRGFSVSAEHLAEEKRIVHRPKQTSRAYRRGFFVFPHETGPHLAFSKSMAQECMVFLANSTCYQHLPTEWKTQDTKKAISSLSNAAGKWFENTVTQNLCSLGIVGTRIKDTVGKQGNRIAIPDSVGELDFLGHDASDNAVVLVEAKMTMPGLEGALWRDDIEQFVLSKKSYASKFRRKIAWVRENLQLIAVALDYPVPTNFRYVMVTLYPCIAAQMIKDFPCVSLTEFMLDFKKTSRWPYSFTSDRLLSK